MLYSKNIFRLMYEKPISKTQTLIDYFSFVVSRIDHHCPICDIFASFETSRNILLIHFYYVEKTKIFTNDKMIILFEFELILPQ